MFAILKFEKSVEKKLLGEIEKEADLMAVVLRDDKNKTRCFAIHRKLYEAYESPPNLLTHTVAEIEAYEKEKEIAASMPDKLLRRWIGSPPPNPFLDSEMSERFDELLEMAQVLDLGNGYIIDQNALRVRNAFEEFRHFSKDVIQFREYELREQAARTLYAVMKINGYSFRWYSFKRKFIRLFLRLFGYDEIECNAIIEQLIRTLRENDKKKSKLSKTKPVIF